MTPKRCLQPDKGDHIVNNGAKKTLATHSVSISNPSCKYVYKGKNMYQPIRFSLRLFRKAVRI
jgi:hypothetical protein